jgi:phage terminase small subunit
MPTKSKTIEVMKEGGGKHWTAKQLEAREKAAAQLKRKKPKGIYAPESLSKEAKVIWNRVLKSVEGLELLDNIDTELLESYCDVVAKKRTLAKKNMDVDDIKAYQAYVRLQKALADSLGLSPASRARLVKKKADEIEDNFGKEFD